MPDPWYCPHCVQSSTRNWNLKTHIKRKHNGAGNPVQKTGFTDDPSLSGTNHAYMSRRSYSTRPVPTFKKVHESHIRNPFAESQEFVRYWVDYLAVWGQLENRLSLNWSNPLAFSPYSFPNLLSSIPDTQMPLRRAFGFRAQPCYICLSIASDPVFYPAEEQNSNQSTHFCNPVHSQPEIFRNLEHYSAFLLKELVIMTGLTNLIAIPLSEPHQEFLELMNPRDPKKPLVLTYSNGPRIDLDVDDLTGHWLGRAITTGKEKLTEEQLSEFFWLGPWATFGFFSIKTAVESYHYFMALTDTDYSRMYGKVT
jgi:hypothetical protein